MEFGVGEQIRTPGLLGAVQVANEIVERNEIVKKKSRAENNKERRINGSPQAGI